ncbi:hypothetical protein AUQ48_16570 [Kocuria flava]|uniref:Uncharacterized protein n=1 Tax=Kocuria flava TaxID=446860 RepID=A0A2N4SY62_9MICC|nr:hypothetical protein AUQ48_16570 [Kocuria flava]
MDIGNTAVVGDLQMQALSTWVEVQDCLDLLVEGMRADVPSREEVLQIVRSQSVKRCAAVGGRWGSWAGLRIFDGSGQDRVQHVELVGNAGAVVVPGEVRSDQ